MLYGFLSLPVLFMLYGLVSSRVGVEELLHPSGEMSARLMLIALAATPVRRIWPDAGWTQWLLRHRRALGIMAFAYAVMHTCLYVIDMQQIEYMLAEFGALGIWTGWLALALFLPLALTSNNAAVSLLGSRWALLHRLVYVAAIAVLVHWIYVHNNAFAAWLHFVPIIILEIIRGYKQRVR